MTYGQGYLISHPAMGWPGASADTVSACRSSVDEALRAPGSFHTRSTDHRMAAIALAAAQMTNHDDAVAVLKLIGQEMNADHVGVSAVIDGDDGPAVKTMVANERFGYGLVLPLDTHPLTAHVLESGEMVQVRTSDPDADPAEVAWMTIDGFSGLLMAPIGSRSNPTGLLELGCRAERPWNRAALHLLPVLLRGSRSA
jgi:hypothetical protein